MFLKRSDVFIVVKLELVIKVMYIITLIPVLILRAQQSLNEFSDLKHQFSDLD